MTKKFKIYQIIFLLLIANLSVFAQQKKEAEKPKPTTRILFIFDASQSMFARWQSNMKIEVAKKLFINLLDSIKDIDNLELALRLYGHQKNYPPQDCNDTKLEVPFGKNNTASIKHEIKTVVPKGTTPIAASLEAAAGDFPQCDNCRNIIVLITDGIEECNGDPCAASLFLQKKGIFLKPFIIGIGSNFKEEYDCVGNYFDASSEEMFKQALNVVISQALNSTTAQVNLLDIYSKPTETNVNMTFYDSRNGAMKYNFIHTLNGKGVPDTLIIDPLPTYKVVAHTIPAVSVDNVKLTAGKHTIIPIDAPQGNLIFKIEGKTTPLSPIQCLIKLKNKTDILNVQAIGENEKYIVGKYDAEILCLPRLIINDIDIKQSYTTTVDIPQPGIATIYKSTNGYGSLFVKEKNNLKWIYNLTENTQTESLMLQPGNYLIVYRSKFTNKSLYTVEKSFKVESGKSMNVKLYEK